MKKPTECQSSPPEQAGETLQSATMAQTTNTGTVASDNQSLMRVGARAQALVTALDFDVIEQSQLIQEEIVPVRIVVLDQNPETFFGETDQVALQPVHRARDRASAESRAPHAPSDPARLGKVSKELGTSASPRRAARQKPLSGRTIAILVSEGTNRRWVNEAREGVEGEGAKLFVIAPKVGGVEVVGGGHLDADHALRTAPSVLFDAVILALSDEGAKALAADRAAVDWVRDAYLHLKVIGYGPASMALLRRAGIPPGSDRGLILLTGPEALDLFLETAKDRHVWDRKTKERPTS